MGGKIGALPVQCLAARHVQSAGERPIQVRSRVSTGQIDSLKESIGAILRRGPEVAICQYKVTLV